ncbi:MAG: MinD/ParA family protein [Deltaproteobacteria bacterium]|nr:MinD/ParA family protein [Deltaproteobacteria bacterium]
MDISLSVKERDGTSHGAQIIAIASGKGGVGKTCLATNLSITLAAQKNKVCLFDADTSLANVNIQLGLSPRLTLEHFVGGREYPGRYHHPKIRS